MSEEILKMKRHIGQMTNSYINGQCMNDDEWMLVTLQLVNKGKINAVRRGAEVLSNYESDDKEHALLLESEDEQNPIDKMIAQMRSNYCTPASNELDRMVVGRSLTQCPTFFKGTSGLNY